MQRLVMLIGVLGLSSCSPTEPSPKLLDIDPGRYLLVSTPSPACTAPTLMKSVGTFVSVAHESSGWVARAETTADGNLEFRFHEVVKPYVSGVAVDGTVTGTGYDRRPLSQPGASLVYAGGGVGGSAIVEAQTAPPAANFIAGRITGQLTITDGVVVVTCTSGEMGLLLPAACETGSTPCP